MYPEYGGDCALCAVLGPSSLGRLVLIAKDRGLGAWRDHCLPPLLGPFLAGCFNIFFHCDVMMALNHPN